MGDRIGAQLVILGGGNMAQAIVRGAIDARELTPAGVVVCEPDASKRAVFESWGVRATASHAEALGALAPDGQVMLAVKPQMLGVLAAQVAPVWPVGGRVVITILAGTQTERVRDVLGGVERGVRVVRAMPNLAASVRQSATALCLGAGAKPGDDELASRVFMGIGQLVLRIDESLMDAFTAVAGSGPAYVFYLAEAMMRAAVELGFTPDDADRMVRETIAGAATLLAQSAESPAKLRSAVTSKGGTTEAAVRVLDSAGAMDVLAVAMHAARDRGRELSGG